MEKTQASKKKNLEKDMDAPIEPKVVIAREDGVMRIMFNRPAKKNALDREMYLTMIAALEEAQADPDLRAVLFCGAGGDFTAGNDLSDFLGISGYAADYGIAVILLDFFNSF